MDSILSNASFDCQALLSLAPRRDNQAMLESGPKFGARLLKFTKASRLDVKAIARACGVTPEAVYGWYKTGRVAKRHLPVLAQLFGVSIEEMLGQAPQSRTTDGSQQWSFEAEKLATLFDTLSQAERVAVWPWLVRMLAKTPALRKTFIPFPVENRRIEAHYGRPETKSATHKEE